METKDTWPNGQNSLVLGRCQNSLVAVRGFFEDLCCRLHSTPISRNYPIPLIIFTPKLTPDWAILMVHSIHGRKTSKFENQILPGTQPSPNTLINAFPDPIRQSATPPLLSTLFVSLMQQHKPIILLRVALLESPRRNPQQFCDFPHRTTPTLPSNQEFRKFFLHLLPSRRIPTTTKRTLRNTLTRRQLSTTLHATPRLTPHREFPVRKHSYRKRNRNSAC